ncbi:hypothetical protein FVEN_g834 [Fusarium venenatum]|uniref:DUF7908 domain-containing protein n=2 Tax=Fusarium venenatum TaxID=56646 RepID=A0A2L2U3P8_9HYPO|nr:uncharacterized protein FVRRES_10757 [Fusarium venenatum]KAG8361676.1 hypothetical protein FVEN_g834 [Fusarium venenatum]CEI70680.1 unnamed protein product [Fusarium venenatum]
MDQGPNSDTASHENPPLNCDKNSHAAAVSFVPNAKIYGVSIKWQLFLALGGTLQGVVGLELIGESDLDGEVICYTYLSTYLAPVDAATTGGVLPTAVPPTTRGILPPYFTNRSTSLPPFTLPSGLESSDIIQEPTSVNLFSSSDFAIPTSESGSLLPTATATATEFSATISGAVSGQDLIFFVAPEIDGSRHFIKRAPGRFIGGNDAVEICTNAAVFSLADGQLLVNGDPVYYAGEPYEQLGGQGPPPDGAVTREFTNVNGLLAFSSSSLPGNSAGFCQDDSGQVYITFGSSPPGCDPVSISVYAVEQCQDGRIIGLDDATTTEPNQSTTIAGPTSSSLTTPDVASASTQISQSSDASPETVKTIQSSESTQVPGSPTGETSDSSLSTFSSSSPATETSLVSTTLIKTTVPSQSFSSFFSSYTETASSDSFSSTITLSTDASSFFEIQSSEAFTSSTVSTEESTTASAIATTTAVSTEPEPSSSFFSTESSFEESTTISDAFTATTEESTTTSEEPTTATTSLCNSVDPLTTVALANPAPVFNDNSNHGIRFQYYTTPEEGSSETIGFQNLLTGRSAQVSFNAANVVVDGTAVEIVTSQTNLFFAYSFDNTECGKGQDRLPEAP